jgi:hypothetical protein
MSETDTTGTTPEGRPAPTLEDSVAVESAVQGDTTVTPPGPLGEAVAGAAHDDPDDMTPRFEEPVPPDAT